MLIVIRKKLEIFAFFIFWYIKIAFGRLELEWCERKTLLFDWWLELERREREIL